MCDPKQAVVGGSQPASLKAARSRRTNPAEGEWDYLQQETLVVLLGVLLVTAILPIFLDRRVMPSLHASLLGISLFAVIVVGYWLSSRNLRAGMAVLVFGSTGSVFLALHWWPGEGIASLLLLPIILATFALGSVAGFGLVVAIIAVLLAPASSSIYTPLPGERDVTLYLIGVTWLVGYLVQRSRSNLLAEIHAYYLQARSQLEEARDHRLKLNQANQDLADAYVQVRRLNDLLQASRLEAEAARRTKEEFVANVSHELRSPLNMIIGFSETILYSPTTYGASLPGPLLSDMRVILRNSQHLSQLINDVLDLSQVEAGQLTLSRDWIDIRELVTEAVQAIEPLYDKKGLELTVAMPYALPPVYCDRLRIRQVLLNLLSNAGRFTSIGGVRVGVENLERKLQLSVRDTGPGISSERQQRIFQPFQQLGDNSTTAKNGGSGLGLSISKRLVELHGGEMWLESEVSVGTTFFVSLPFYPPTGIKSGAERWIHPYSAYETRERSRVLDVPVPIERILVLEKLDVLHHQMKLLLGEQAEVIRVRDVDEIQAEMAYLAPSVLLINDARAMADRRFSRGLANLTGRIPIVSCYVPGKQEAWNDLNVVDYLVKPVTREKLLAVAKQAVPAGGTILVVEDEPDMARLISRQLSSVAGEYRILRAGDGTAALEFMGERRPDFVFLDLGLPGQDGYTILHKKNANPEIKAIPVAIISARDPLGAPVVAGRLRVELADGLSIRDIVRCTMAISQSFSPAKRSGAPGSAESSLDQPVSA